MDDACANQYTMIPIYMDLLLSTKFRKGLVRRDTVRVGVEAGVLTSDRKIPVAYLGLDSQPQPRSP